ncbi:hypothetical protein AB6735_13430 [Mucilaginibacter sp. RCC_168]|uniref:hypothetical protein n=1 Tax=Mucilaginibacter sp. RCC_168 TaxID=3239221 RepID=UPI003525E067
MNIPVSFEMIERHLGAQPAGFSIVKISDYEYKFLADYSFGTLIMKGAPSMVEGIKVFGTFKPGERTTSVMLEARPRMELFIIILLWLIVASKVLPGSDTMPWWVNVIFPVFLIWTWFLYRFQENRLRSKVEAYLSAIK